MKRISCPEMRSIQPSSVLIDMEIGTDRAYNASWCAEKHLIFGILRCHIFNACCSNPKRNAEELIAKILGQRCSRREWVNLDLKAKDKLQQRAEAGNVSGHTCATKTSNSTKGVVDPEDIVIHKAATSTNVDIIDLDEVECRIRRRRV